MSSPKLSAFSWARSSEAVLMTAKKLETAPSVARLPRTEPKSDDSDQLKKNIKEELLSDSDTIDSDLMAAIISRRPLSPASGYTEGSGADEEPSGTYPRPAVLNASDSHSSKEYDLPLERYPEVIPVTGNSMLAGSFFGGSVHYVRPQTDSVDLTRDDNVFSRSIQGVPLRLPSSTHEAMQVLEAHVREACGRRRKGSLESTTSGSSPLSSMPELPVHLPLASYDDLRILESYLQGNEDRLNALISYFSKQRGPGLVSKTNSILRCLLTNQLATEYNFLGRRSKKRPFRDLVLKKAVVQAVQNESSEFTEDKIDDAIKVWLKHAPRRVNIENKRSSIEMNYWAEQPPS